MLRVVDCDKAIVIRAGRVVDPGVGFGHLMKGKFRARRECRVIGVDLADAKDDGRSATIAFLFPQTAFILTGEAPTPGQPILAEQDRNRCADPMPGARGGTLEALQLAAHGIPVGREGDN